jgi:hypothetical protein
MILGCPGYCLKATLLTAIPQQVARLSAVMASRERWASPAVPVEILTYEFFLHA